MAVLGFISRDCEERSGKTPPFTVGMRAKPFALMQKTIKSKKNHKSNKKHCMLASMCCTLKIKPDKSNELIQTAKIWNAACQDVMDFGFAAHDYNKTRLNRAKCSYLRDKHPTLPSALIQTARDGDMLERLRFEKSLTSIHLELSDSISEP